MSSDNPKDLVMDQLARVAKALGNPHRLNLLELLAQGEHSVEALTQGSGLPLANVSQHLQQLRRAGLVTGRREGKYIHYRLSGNETLEAMRALRRVAEQHLAEYRDIIARYFQDQDGMEPVAMDDLLQRLRDGVATVIDVRPEGEYSQGHLPGALSIPLHQLERRLKELPEGQEIVAYCRGPYCLLAFEAVALLRQRGRKARRMVDGFPEWQAAGRPVESKA